MDSTSHNIDDKPIGSGVEDLDDIGKDVLKAVQDELRSLAFKGGANELADSFSVRIHRNEIIVSTDYPDLVETRDSSRDPTEKIKDAIRRREELAKRREEAKKNADLRRQWSKYRAQVRQQRAAARKAVRAIKKLVAAEVDVPPDLMAAANPDPIDKPTVAPVPVLTPDGKIAVKDSKSEVSEEDGKWRHPGLQVQDFLDRAARRGKRVAVNRIRQQMINRVRQKMGVM